jgi:hypothetical protein
MRVQRSRALSLVCEVALNLHHFEDAIKARLNWSLLFLLLLLGELLNFPLLFPTNFRLHMIQAKATGELHDDNSQHRLFQLACVVIRSYAVQ